MPLNNYRITGLISAYALTNNAGTIVKTQLPFANSLAFDNDVNEIEWEGDGSKVRLEVLQGVNMTLTTDYMDLLALNTVFAKTNVTASLPSGEAMRTYYGDSTDQSGVVAGLEANVTAVRLDTNVNKTLRVVAPVAQWSPPQFSELTTADKGQTEIAIYTTKTTTDIAGAALPGVTAGGSHMYISELT